MMIHSSWMSGWNSFIGWGPFLRVNPGHLHGFDHPVISSIEVLLPASLGVGNLYSDMWVRCVRCKCIDQLLIGDLQQSDFFWNIKNQYWFQYSWRRTRQMADLFSMSFEKNRGLLFLMTLFIGCRMTSLLSATFTAKNLAIVHQIIFSQQPGWPNKIIK